MRHNHLLYDMTVLEWITGKLLDPIWAEIKHQWKGFVLGSVAAAVILIYHYQPIVDDHIEMGDFVGTYTIVKGENITVSRNELNIYFMDLMYRELRKTSPDSPPDSVFVYPVFEYYPKARYEDTPIR